MLILVALSRGGLDPMGKPLGTDYTSFWTASALALAGHPVLAYNTGAHHVAQIAITGRDTGYAAFFYPPIFLLLCLPLATLPYLPSLASWLVITGVAYARTVRAWLGEQFGWMPVFAFPAVLSNIGHGQNAFLSAALFGSGAIWLGRRPILAGVCFGTLVYKPHLGLVIPLALTISGRWKSIAAAAATVVAFAAASFAVLGADAWRGFLADSGLARSTLEQGLVGDAKMQSAFAAIRLWGGPLSLAYTVQGLVVLSVVAALFLLHRRKPRGPAEGPAMIVAGLMASPFLLDYDLAILAVPLAWLLRDAVSTGFRDWEKLTLAVAFGLPAVSRTLAMTLHLPLAPFVLAALFTLIVRRGLGFPSAPDPKPETPSRTGFEGQAAQDVPAAAGA